MIRVFEMFAGYGGASFGLKKAGIEFECVGYSEVDKYAQIAYTLNHKGYNYGDCRDIDPKELPDFDLLTGGFPCQDVSIAGKRDLSKGRTMLINDVFRIVKVKKPKYILLENVKGLLSMKDLWDSIRYTLHNLGYGVAYKVLNSKDYGVPQNRERVWIVCKHGGWEFMEFQFPTPIPLSVSVRDLLEDDVDKKYYLSEKAIKGIMDSEFMERKPIKDDVCRTLKIGGDVPCIVHNTQKRSADRPSIQKNKNAGGSGHLSRSDGVTYCLDGGNNQCLEISPCITTELAHSTSTNWSAEKYKRLTNEWRRLTPIECFRLMGFKDGEINLNGLSDTQKYKLAGNGWDVNVTSLIFSQLKKGGMQ